MDKRKLNNPDKVDKVSVSQDEIDKKIQEGIEKELARRESLDMNLTNSDVTNKPISPNDPIYKEGLALFIRAGKRRGKNWTEQDYKETLEYGNKARSANPL